MRVDAPDSPGQVPAIPGVAARTDATAADLVPVADRSATGACKKLAEDAAQTTLMVVEFQRWYREQVTELASAFHDGSRIDTRR